MTHTTQKALRQGIKDGYYTAYTGQTIARYTKIAVGTGIYGINCGLIRADDTGIFCAITARTTDLFKFF